MLLSEIQFEDSLQFAQILDEQDPLADYRDQFFIPVKNGREVIYFCGNSLGLQPKHAIDYLEVEMQDWRELGVEGHFHSRNPWFHYHKFLKEPLAEITGSLPSEVVAMNSLTTNLHLMMVSFYRPTARRYKILIEAGAFPSDYYAVESQLRWHGFDPGEGIIEVSPRQGEYTIREEDIIREIHRQGESLALVLLGGVNYYTGQCFDMKAITEAAHAVGAIAGFDLAHAVGNVELRLHDWDVDFAVWCSYKYLNSGPGGVGGVFIHDRHGQNTGLPRFAGWWGYDEATRFEMKKGFRAMPGADGWQLSNAPVLSMAVHRASLELFQQAGMHALRQKSLKLTGYLLYLLEKHNRGKYRVLTPQLPAQHGCQVSILVPKGGKKRYNHLKENGFVIDWREPDVIRVAPVPFYNRFEEVYHFARAFCKS